MLSRYFQILWKIICFLIANSSTFLIEIEETNPFDMEFKTLATLAQFTCLTSFIINIMIINVNV